MSYIEIISEAKLSDNKLEDRDFARIEIIPKAKAKVTGDSKDRVLNVDEVETLPKWFSGKRVDTEIQCWGAWSESVKVNLVVGNEKIKVTDSFLIL